MTPRSSTRASGVLLATILSATPACDAIIGLGEPPSGESAAPSSGSSSGSAGATSSGGEATSVGGGNGTASSGPGGGAGGEGGGGGTTSGGGGSGGHGGSPTGFLAGCGMCEGLTAEECPACSRDGRCLQRQWTIPFTGRVVPDSDLGGILNRYSRAVAVTPDAIAFTRSRISAAEEGGIPKLFLTFVRDGVPGPHVDVELPGSSAGALGVVAATPSGRIFATTLSQTLPLFELIDGRAPELRPGRTLDGEYALNHLIASGRDDELILAHRTTSNLYRFDPDEIVVPPCSVGVSTTPAHEPSDMVVSEGRVGVLQYTGGRVQHTATDAACGGDELTVEAETPGKGITYGHAMAGTAAPLWVVGRDAGRGVLVRVDVPGAPRVEVYSSAALDMRGPHLYVAGPLGGVFQCLADAPGIADLTECTVVVGAEAGLVSLIHANEGSVITVGYVENGQLVSDTRVVCRELEP